jgi:hypothetical protein
LGAGMGAVVPVVAGGVGVLVSLWRVVVVVEICGCSC